MNWRSLLLTASAFIGYFCFVSAVSASPEELDEKTAILKAIVQNLPKACKELNGRGCFDVLCERSYDCLFEEKFSAKKASIVMALLMQRGDEKMVQEIAKRWVSKRNWGPFSQSEIADELFAVISVKNSIHISGNKNMKIELKLKSIYDTFKSLVKSGKELIVGNQIYYNVAAKVFNLAYKVDKEDKEFASTSAIILDNFYSIAEKNSGSAGAAEGVDNVKLTQASYAVHSLNRLAEKKIIGAEPWEIYGPFICSKLNSIFGTDFGMVERVSKEKKSSKNRSDDDSSSSSDEDEKNKEEGKGKVDGDLDNNEPAKYPKFIELMTKPSKKINNELLFSQSSSNSITTETFLRIIIISGSAFLLLVLIYFVYNHLSSKRREESSNLSDI